jgi:hypothetical protein
VWWSHDNEHLCKYFIAEGIYPDICAMPIMHMLLAGNSLHLHVTCRPYSLNVLLRPSGLGRIECWWLSNLSASLAVGTCSVNGFTIFDSACAVFTYLNHNYSPFIIKQRVLHVWEFITAYRMNCKGTGIIPSVFSQFRTAVGAASLLQNEGYSRLVKFYSSSGKVFDIRLCPICTFVFWCLGTGIC